ncbi:MAG: site-specific DNA-methyltransferase, partial [Gammaproteobacteria bacterium]|nr:site-specific DNA-methyltransferase [Gammaproteobacteria bacterium]
MEPSINALYYGDCLEVMRTWPDRMADLVYLDPPFNSNADYNVLFRPETGEPNQPPTAQTIAFHDTWQWDSAAAHRVQRITEAVASPAHNAILALQAMIPRSGMLAYISYMAERLTEIHRILRPTGNVFLHCDPTASHYLKLLLDSIFGSTNFRNEIVWKRRRDTHNLATRHMGRIHDTIFYYARSTASKYNIQYLNYDAAYIASHYKHEDKRGRYRILPCTNESGGNKPYTFRGITRAWRFSEKNMERLFTNDELVQLTKHGPFYYKKYLSDAKGVPIQDIWDDIAPVRGKETLGSTTQK